MVSLPRPGAQAGLLAELVAEAAPRLVKKLDSEPQMALGWTWTRQESSCQVTTSNQEVVALRLSDDTLVSLADLSCSCLLAPRCLHRLAVLSVLEPRHVEPSADDAKPVELPADSRASLALTRAQRLAAEQLWRVSAGLLQRGALAAGVVAQADLLRAAYECKSTALHRAAAAATRVCQSVRELRSDSANFGLSRLAHEMEELLAVGYALHQLPPKAEWMGQARRGYQEVGNLKLHGLLTEPVVTGSGFAGALTSLVDSSGRVWTVSDVTPGPPAQARAAYLAGSSMAGVSLPHRELGRSSFLVQRATASADGRLGAGQKVSGVRTGPNAWSDPELARLWEQPWDQQLDRACAKEQALLFFEATVLGAERDGLIVLHEDRPLRMVATQDHEALSYRDNLALLARCPETRLRWVARLDLDSPRTLKPVAVGAEFFPPEWQGRCNLGCDRLQAAFFSRLQGPPSRGAGRGNEAESAKLASNQEGLEVLEPLRRRLHRMVLAGRASFPQEAGREVKREVTLLEARMLGCGAALLAELHEAARDSGRDWSGRLLPGDPGRLGRAWLAAMRYLSGANRSLVRSAWS